MSLSVVGPNSDRSGTKCQIDQSRCWIWRLLPVALTVEECPRCRRAEQCRPLLLVVSPCRNLEPRIASSCLEILSTTLSVLASQTAPFLNCTVLYISLYAPSPHFLIAVVLSGEIGNK